MLEEHCLDGTTYAQDQPIRIYGTEAWYQADRLKIWVGHNRHLAPLWPRWGLRYPLDFPPGYVLVGGMTVEQVRQRGVARKPKDMVAVW